MLPYDTKGQKADLPLYPLVSSPLDLPAGNRNPRLLLREKRRKVFYDGNTIHTTRLRVHAGM